MDKLQPEARDMNPEYLKKNFDGRFVFHVCILTAGHNAFGAVEDIIRNVRETLEIMMPAKADITLHRHML